MSLNQAWPEEFVAHNSPRFSEIEPGHGCGENGDEEQHREAGLGDRRLRRGTHFDWKFTLIDQIKNSERNERRFSNDAIVSLR